MVTKETVAALFAHGQMVTVKWPGSGELIVGLQRHMIDDAMAEWAKLSADDRGRRMRSLASLGPETCWCDIIADHGGGLRERDQAWDGGHPFGSLVSSINSSGVIDLIASR